MKRLAAVLAVLAIFCSGCFSIPSAIKTEIDFADTVVDTALRELKEATNAEQVAETSSRALLRLAPHTENLRLWAEGQGVDDDSGP
jgi:hypothetical protein